MVLHAPARQVGLTVFRLPLLALNTITGVAMRLPQLPGLAEENARLRRQLSEQQLELVALRESLRHAGRLEQLQAAFGAQGRSVSLIGRTTTPAEHVVIIDHGADQGIALDSILVDLQGLVGRIVEVHPKTALALLVSDPTSRIACLIERSRELGLLTGNGGTLCEMIHLDLDADIEVDDRVVTAGLGGPFPKGILVGTVLRVERRHAEASTVAWVRPSVRLRQLEETLCLPPASSL